MARPKRPIDVVRREIYLPVNVAAILETLFFDEFKQKPQYGGINEHIISLVRKDLRERGLLQD